MTKQIILDKALIRFAHQGYNGTSMSQLAEDVGIRKSSIYSHFKNKDEIYVSVIEGSIDAELKYTDEFFSTANEGVTIDLLYRYLNIIAQRFEDEPYIRLLLSSSYIPPAKLADKVVELANRYIYSMDSTIESIFEVYCSHNRYAHFPPEILAPAYVGIMYSAQAELMFSNLEKFYYRLDSMWEIFKLSL